MAMPEQSYSQIVYGENPGARGRITVRLVSGRHGLTSYGITLATEVNGQWITVRTYDWSLAHNEPHMHRHTLMGAKLPAEVEDRATIQDAFRAALDNVRTGWEEMSDQWRR